MPTVIQHQLFFPHSPETVWKFLTDKTLIAQWLMNNDFEPRLGYDFQFTSRPAPQIDFDGIAYCKVLEIVPAKKLVYSWKCGPGKGKITLDSTVTWTLEKVTGGTQLYLMQTGFKELENYNIYAAMNDGWKKHMNMILEQINTEKNGSTKP